jgi:hypothetical protein
MEVHAPRLGRDRTNTPVCPCGTGTTACQNERFFIHHFSILILHFKPFAVASAHRLESGLVRLVGRATSALSKRRVENFLDDVKMMENLFVGGYFMITQPEGGQAGMPVLPV